MKASEIKKISDESRSKLLKSLIDEVETLIYDKALEGEYQLTYIGECDKKLIDHLESEGYKVYHYIPIGLSQVRKTEEYIKINWE